MTSLSPGRHRHTFGLAAGSAQLGNILDRRGALAARLGAGDPSSRSGTAFAIRSPLRHHGTRARTLATFREASRFDRTARFSAAVRPWLLCEPGGLRDVRQGASPVMIKPFRPGYFSRTQLTRIYGCSMATIRRWEKKKKIQFEIHIIHGRPVHLFPVGTVLSHAASIGALGNISKATTNRAFDLFDTGMTPRAVAEALELHPAQGISLQHLWVQSHGRATNDNSDRSGPQLVRDTRRRQEAPPPPAEQSVEEWRAEVDALHQTREEKERAETLVRQGLRAERRDRMGLSKLRTLPAPPGAPRPPESGPIAAPPASAPSAAPATQSPSDASESDAVDVIALLRKLGGLS